MNVYGWNDVTPFEPQTDKHVLVWDERCKCMFMACRNGEGEWETVQMMTRSEDKLDFVPTLWRILPPTPEGWIQYKSYEGEEV